MMKPFHSYSLFLCYLRIPFKITWKSSYVNFIVQMVFPKNHLLFYAFALQTGISQYIS